MDILDITSLYKTTPVTGGAVPTVEKSSDFGSIFEAALNMIGEANAYQNKAQNEEIKFLLGESDNSHDVMIAARKAQIALQYTAAVRDRFIQGYQQIMQMQI